jgi:hypothetical protein
LQVLNRQDKQHLVIELYRQGKTIREIASVAHLSFSDIGSIIRKIDGRDDVTLEGQKRNSMNKVILWSAQLSDLGKAIDIKNQQLKQMGK